MPKLNAEAAPTWPPISPSSTRFIAPGHLWPSPLAEQHRILAKTERLTALLNRPEMTHTARHAHPITP